MVRWVDAPGTAMDGVAADYEAFAYVVVFLKYFRDVREPRQCERVTYPLDEVLLLCLFEVLAAAETFVDIARFGARKWLFAVWSG
jgi:hypothetical protein